MLIGIQKREKVGDITVKNLIGLLIAAVAVFILASLFFKLLAPVYDVHEETTKSYFENLRGTVSELKKNGVADFSALALSKYDKNSQAYFVVYFDTSSEIRFLFEEDFQKEAVNAYRGGSFTTVTDKGYRLYYNFFLGKVARNTMCICTRKSFSSLSGCYGGLIGDEFKGQTVDVDCKFTCERCIDLDYPLVVDADESVFQIGKFDFLKFRQGKDSGGEIKYFLEAVEYEL